MTPSIEYEPIQLKDVVELLTKGNKKVRIDRILIFRINKPTLAARRKLKPLVY